MQRQLWSFQKVKALILSDLLKKNSVPKGKEREEKEREGRRGTMILY